MSYDITTEMIINEFLSNWFTFEELAQYLCIDLETVKKELLSVEDNKVLSKINRHADFIEKYNSNNVELKQLDAKSIEIVEMANYIINNKTSLKKTAEHFNIGKTTVFDRIYEKLPYIDLYKFHDVFMILMSNKSFDTNNKLVTEKVLTCTKLLLEGFTSDEICKKLNISRNVLQRNLTLRLKNIDSDMYLSVKKILNERKLERLVPFEKGKCN